MVCQALSTLRPHYYRLKPEDVDEKKLSKSINDLYVFSDFSLQKLLNTNYLNLAETSLCLIRSELARRREVRLESFIESLKDVD